MAVTQPPPGDRSARLQVVEELGEMFNRCAVGYYACLDAEEWSAAFEYHLLIEQIHELAEKVAA
jgi:hypothetical protein